MLVIDADLRRPRMHRLFNTDNAIGLSNLLSNVVRQGDVLTMFRPTGNPNVTFMSAGTIPPNPADLLTSQKMAMTLHFCVEEIRPRHHRQPADHGPVRHPDPEPPGRRDAAGGCAKQVTRKAAKNALARLRSAGGHVVGATLSKFAVSQLDYNYAYRYMQYNYYSYDGAAGQLEDHATPKPAKSRLGGRTGALLSGLLGRGGGAGA